MKINLLKITALFFAIIVFVQVSNSQVVIEQYDKFKGLKILQTQEASTGIVNSANFRLSIIGNFDEQGNSLFAFSVSCVSYYQNNLRPQVIMLIDGKRETVGQIMVYSTSRGIWSTTNSRLTVSLDLIKRIANAKTLEVQVGSAEFSLGGVFTTIFSEFVKKVDSISPATSQSLAKSESVNSQSNQESSNKELSNPKTLKQVSILD